MSNSIDPDQPTEVADSPEQAASHQPGKQRPAKRWRKIIGWSGLVLLLGGCVGIGMFLSRYTTEEETTVDIYEFPTFEYAEDPSGRSPYYSEYKGLSLIHI